MKIICISDTHNQHENIELPDGDILIHAGDFSEGKEKETFAFLSWLENQPHEYKVITAGNHDFWVEANENLFTQMCAERGIIYLNDTAITINNLLIVGRAATPDLKRWAFYEERKETKRKLALLSPNIDILITHAPPRGILDHTCPNFGDMEVGCPILKDWVIENKPMLHIFGHIHEEFGQIITTDTIFVNASQINEYYKLVNIPIIINL